MKLEYSNDKYWNNANRKNNLLWSTGSKLVSFLLSKPTPNLICGTVHLPKLPIPDEVEVEVVVALAAVLAAGGATILAAAEAVGALTTAFYVTQ